MVTTLEGLSHLELMWQGLFLWRCQTILELSGPDSGSLRIFEGPNVHEQWMSSMPDESIIACLGTWATLICGSFPRAPSKRCHTKRSASTRT